MNPDTPTIAPIIPEPGKGLAITALVLGIIAFILGWVPFVGILLGIVAIILGAIALKRRVSTGMGIIGIVGGSLGTLTSLITSALFILSIVAAPGIVNQAQLDQNTQDRLILEQKKDFKKGETLRFYGWDIKVNSVERNYPVPSDGTAFTDNTGKEFVVINFTATNVNVEIEDLPFLPDNPFSLTDGTNTIESVLSFPKTPTPRFVGGQFAIGESKSGNIGFNVPEGTGELKVFIEFGSYTDPQTREKKTAHYTLEI